MPGLSEFVLRELGDNKLFIKPEALKTVQALVQKQLDSNQTPLEKDKEKKHRRR